MVTFAFSYAACIIFLLQYVLYFCSLSTYNRRAWMCLSSYTTEPIVCSNLFRAFFPVQIAAIAIALEMKECVVMTCHFGLPMVDSYRTLSSTGPLSVQ